jgi:hypothetical protein
LSTCTSTSFGGVGRVSRRHGFINDPWFYVEATIAWLAERVNGWTNSLSAALEGESDVKSDLHTGLPVEIQLVQLGFRPVPRRYQTAIHENAIAFSRGRRHPVFQSRSDIQQGILARVFASSCVENEVEYLPAKDAEFEKPMGELCNSTDGQLRPMLRCTPDSFSARSGPIAQCLLNISEARLRFVSRLWHHRS